MNLTYDLNGTLAENNGGPSLVDYGGTLGPNGYFFGVNQGLSLSGTGISDVYSIEIRFYFDSVNASFDGYQRIIDFKDRTSDSGFYDLNGSATSFYSQSTAPFLSGGSSAGHVFFNGTYADLLLQRDGSGLFSVSVNGTLAYSFLDSTAAAVFSGPDNIIYFFMDDFQTLLNYPPEAGTGFIDYVRVTTPNSAPIIFSDGGGDTASISVAENSMAVTTVTADDPDAGQTLSYSIIGGADSAFFGFDPAGALTFLTAPDFENPSDAGANNVYDVTVQASDGHGGIDTQAIAVTVTNIGGLTIPGTNGGASLVGGGEEDLVLGGNANDSLYGDLGNDTLYGGNGKDNLNGGAGNNLLSGGNGSDRFQFGSDATGFNRITDFANDHLQFLDGVTVTSTTSTNDGTQLHLSSGGVVLLAGIAVVDWHQLL